MKDQSKYIRELKKEQLKLKRELATARKMVKRNAFDGHYEDSELEVEDPASEPKETAKCPRCQSSVTPFDAGSFRIGKCEECDHKFHLKGVSV